MITRRRSAGEGEWLLRSLGQLVAKEYFDVASRYEIKIVAADPTTL
jgi:hypothetical protein